MGVFAIKEIPKGINVNNFLFETNESIIEKADECLCEYRLINKYAVTLPNNRIQRPKNFIRMSIGWYLNHSYHPNIKIKNNLNVFLTLRKIKKDEEITINYKQLSKTEMGI